MEFIFGELGTIQKFVIAFILVLGLIAVTAFLIRRFGNGRIATAGGGRGRQPRLAVLDSAVVDQKRRLVLIRRDNSEHLLLIGGPTDVVVETNIVRTGAPAPLAQPLSEARRGNGPAAAPRGSQPQIIEAEIDAPIVPEPPLEEPVRTPLPAPRPQPAAFTPPPPLPSREPRPVAHPSANAQPQMPLPPVPAPAPIPAPAPTSAAPQPEPHSQPEPQPQPQPQPKLDPQYADMAQRLEAALRRPATVPPAASSPQPPMPRNDTRPMMPQVNAPRPASMPPRPMASAPEPMSKGPAAPAAPASSAPNPFDSLEAEMANLLGQEAKKRT